MHAGWINPGGYAFREWVGEEQVPAVGGSGDPRFGFIVVPVNTATSGRSLIRYIESINALEQLEIALLRFTLDDEGAEIIGDD